MKAIGVKSCVQDSSGNAGNAVAAYCARAGIQCELYGPSTDVLITFCGAGIKSDH